MSRYNLTKEFTFETKSTTIPEEFKNPHTFSGIVTSAEVAGDTLYLTFSNCITRFSTSAKVLNGLKPIDLIGKAVTVETLPNPTVGISVR